MGPDLEKAILEISLRMRLLKAMQEDESHPEDLTERDVMILGLLNERGRMTVSQIAAADPNVSDSTISTNITKLWRDKQMVSKTISPENQRTTIVELTDKGSKAIELVNQQRAERFKTLFKAIEVTDDEREVFVRSISLLGEMGGWTVLQANSYPAWTPDPTSSLLQLVKKEYKHFLNKPAFVMATHGGLETAFIGEKIP